jgi:2-iminobutanoate/2-iminopropanoate deaminase
MKNINALLKAEGLTPSNVVKSTIFLTELNNFVAVNNAYTDFFQKPYPARSCVEVSKLPKDALVEIEVIAHQ